MPNTFHSEQLDAFRKHPEQSLLVLDYDGSHSAFVKRADDATMYPGLKEQLIALGDRGYTIAFSSGRELNNLIAAVGTPHIKNYAGSHGNHVQVFRNGLEEDRNYMPSERVREELHNIFSQEIIKKINSTGTYHVERKPASVVLHWREYCEENGIKGKALEAFEKNIFTERINPAIKAYNQSETNPNYHLKAENHGMNADISQLRARNKGDALDDFAIDRLVQKTPLYQNILTVNDSFTDGNMIRKADEYARVYKTNAISVSVEQASTPQWMLDRNPPHIVLRADREKDPEMHIGGISQLKNVYDYLLKP